MEIENYYYLTNLHRKVCNLRDPTGISVFVFLKINADFKLSTRWLPLAVVELCAADSLGTVHGLPCPPADAEISPVRPVGQMLKA